MSVLQTWNLAKRRPTGTPITRANRQGSNMNILFNQNQPWKKNIKHVGSFPLEEARCDFFFSFFLGQGKTKLIPALSN